MHVFCLEKARFNLHVNGPPELHLQDGPPLPTLFCSLALPLFFLVRSFPLFRYAQLLLEITRTQQTIITNYSHGQFKILTSWPT